MLLKREALDGIADGTVTLAFRRWDQPRVRAGSLLRTRIGVVGVDSIELVTRAGLSDADARAAGYRSLEQLERELDRRGQGPIYRIRLSLRGPDPRVALRERADLDDGELAALSATLARLDRSRASGAWTVPVLSLIRAEPGVRAEDLAARFGREKRPFKADVRKLKELGLTESLRIGYRLSARGAALLDRLTGGTR